MTTYEAQRLLDNSQDFIQSSEGKAWWPINVDFPEADYEKSRLMTEEQLKAGALDMVYWPPLELPAPPQKPLDGMSLKKNTSLKSYFSTDLINLLELAVLENAEAKKRRKKEGKLLEKLARKCCKHPPPRVRHQPY